MITTWNRTYTVTRPLAAATYVKGRLVKAATEEIEIQATIQPLNSKEVLLLPEGQRTKETIKIYSATELNPGSNKTKKNGDTIAYDGNGYEIISVADWSKMNGIKHFKMVGQKIDADAGSRE